MAGWFFRVRAGGWDFGIQRMDEAGEEARGYFMVWVCVCFFCFSKVYSFVFFWHFDGLFDYLLAYLLAG
jgi:hypothetical protein